MPIDARLSPLGSPMATLQIVQAHQGTSDVISIEGQASTDIVALPIGSTISGCPDVKLAPRSLWVGGNPLRRELQLRYDRQLKGGSDAKREHSRGG
jgi:hypothetical protein